MIWLPSARRSPGLRSPLLRSRCPPRRSGLRATPPPSPHSSARSQSRIANPLACTFLQVASPSGRGQGFDWESGVKRSIPNSICCGTIVHIAHGYPVPPRTDAAAPASKALDVGEPPTCEAHIGTLPILQTPIGELHTVDTPIRDAPVVKPHVVQTPIVTPPIGAPHIRGVKKSWPHKIRLTRTAQDGHSASEQAVYRALWDAAAPDVNDTRVVSIGYRTIASIVGLDPSNVKPALQSLQRKLAIDLIAQEDIHSCRHALTGCIRTRRSWSAAVKPDSFATRRAKAWSC